MTARDMEVEAAIYWRSARMLAALRLVPRLTPELLAKSGETFSDLEAIAMHSDWPKLRATAQNTLDGALTVRATG
jgi:hypothetical protein